jgi:pyruvate formate lyase activating enzyme
MKIFDPEKHRLYTGRSNEIIMDNFCNIALLKKEIIVRIPVVNKITDTRENLDSIKKFVHGINKDIPIEYISYNPLTRNNYDKLGIAFFL